MAQSGGVDTSACNLEGKGRFKIVRVLMGTVRRNGRLVLGMEEFRSHRRADA